MKVNRKLRDNTNPEDVEYEIETPRLEKATLRMLRGHEGRIQSMLDDVKAKITLLEAQ